MVNAEERGHLEQRGELRNEDHNWFHVFFFEERNSRDNTISLKRHCKYLAKKADVLDKMWP